MTKELQQKMKKIGMRWSGGEGVERKLTPKKTNNNQKKPQQPINNSHSAHKITKGEDQEIEDTMSSIFSRT